MSDEKKNATGKDAAAPAPTGKKQSSRSKRSQFPSAKLKQKK